MNIRLPIGALFLSIFVAACESGSSTGPAPIAFTPVPTPTGQGFVAQYAPTVDLGPYPNDIYNLPGQTLSVPVKVTRPLAAALNTLDGFSTSAEITAPFTDRLNPATLVPFNPLAATGTETIYVLDATNGVPLVAGVHYETRISTAFGTNGSVLEIVPLIPLAPDTTYVFILTDGIQSAAGVPAGPDTVFGLVRDAHLANVTTGNPGLDALLPAIGPVVDAGVGLLGLAGGSIVSAWSVSTQSIDDTLEWIDATAVAQNSLLASAGLSTASVGLLGAADIYVGYMEAPYFGNPAAPLTSFWVNASLQPLTRDDPVPIPQGGTLRLPVLATLPNAGSGQIEPANGWPAVLVIHGVTVNRTVMLTLADAFAVAGFAVIAIDLPLHGVTNTASPFYQGPGSAFGDNERHFNLDNVGPVGDLTPDGQIDNGWQILNVGNPLNARDNGRQTISDLIHLARTAPTMDFDGDTVSDIDGSRIHFVSLSLGSIFSTAFVAVNNDFSTATMSSPGGPFSQFLYDPNATDFGLPIRRGIEAQGLSFGTVGFDEFARDLQTVLDPIDPVNFAARAAANHPLHVIEILGDTAVTPALTDKVAELMGVADVSQSAFDAAGLRGIVRFTAGGHSSLFNPAIDIAVTIEMQTQTVTFAASGGTSIPIGDPTLVQ
jgi:hypothetical protein